MTNHRPDPETLGLGGPHNRTHGGHEMTAYSRDNNATRRHGKIDPWELTDAERVIELLERTRRIEAMLHRLCDALDVQVNAPGAKQAQQEKGTVITAIASRVTAAVINKLNRSNPEDFLRSVSGVAQQPDHLRQQRDFRTSEYQRQAAEAKAEFERERESYVRRTSERKYPEWLRKWLP